jgi:hypothetical protein
MIACSARRLGLNRNIMIPFPKGKRMSLSSRAPKPALGPTQPPIQWVPQALTPGMKRMGGGGGVKLTPDHHLVLRLIRSAAIRPLPHSS